MCPLNSARHFRFSKRKTSSGFIRSRCVLLRVCEYRMKENWIYRRGDVYLANLDPYIGSEQGGTRPVVVLQNNTGNYYCPTLIVAPITSKSGKKPSQPTHYYAERIRGLELPGMVLLEQIKTIDKRRVKKYLGRMTRQQMDEIGEAIEEALGLYVPEEMEAP